MSLIEKISSLNFLKPNSKLTASDGAEDDFFGTSVAFNKDGNVLAIGADGNDTKGSVYLFSGSGTSFEQQTKLTASDGAESDQFGTSLAFSKDGSVLAIGAVDVDTKGSVYLFSGSGTNWTQQTKLTASDGAEGDDFGTSLAFNEDGSVLAVGEFGNGVSDDGAIYLFSGSGTTWTQQTKLNVSGISITGIISFSNNNNNNVLVVPGIKSGTTTPILTLFSGSGTNLTKKKEIPVSSKLANTGFGVSQTFNNNDSVYAVGGVGEKGYVHLYDLQLKKKKKKKSTIQLDNSQVDEYADQKQYNNIDILGIVKTNIDGNEVNYLILENDENNPYYNILKAKNDKKTLEDYKDIYGVSAEIYNYIVSLLENL